MQIDPIKFEVIRNALTEATEEMVISLRRSAYSTNIKPRADFSCAFFDADCQAVAQAFTQPVHLGSLSVLIPRALAAYGSAKLAAGDAILVNDPYHGGVHLNDITLISPVFVDGRIVGYVANIAHHVDVGGGAPASIGAFQEVYQEGIIIPPVKLVEQGKIHQDLFRLVVAQMRSARETPGDLRAQVAANTTGIRRVVELMQRLGTETVLAYMRELLEYGERRTRAEISMLPAGTYSAEGVVDSDGFTDKPVLLKARIVIEPDGILFDLEGCDPQRRAPVNATFAQTYSACAFVLKALINPDVPANAGFYRAVRVRAPEGTVVNCTHPAPVVGGWETQVRLNEVMFKALAEALPGKIPAGCKGMMCQTGFGGIDPRRGELYTYYETIGGGFGGRAGIDGPDAVQNHGQNTENAPIEEVEINYPVRIKRYELIENSEGAGTFRGGLGLRRDYEFPDHGASFTTLADRDRWGPWGLFGGLPGRKANYLVNPDGEKRRIGSKCTVRLNPGDVVSIQSCGGGGYGPPLKRDPKLVLRDVVEKKISLARARTVYGVVIEGNKVDARATRELRAGLRGRQK